MEIGENKLFKDYFQDFGFDVEERSDDPEMNPSESEVLERILVWMFV